MMMTRRWLTVLLLALALTGCDTEEEGTSDEDTSVEDTGGAEDSASVDTSEDTGTAEDAATDAPPEDTAVGEDAAADAPPEDTSTGGDTAEDTGTAEDTTADAPPEDTVEDTGSGVDPDTFVTDCLADVNADTFDMRVLRWTGASGEHVGLARYIDPDAFGTSGTTVFKAERLAIAVGETQLCLAADALEYTVSHHNFDDLVEGLDAGVTYSLSMSREGYELPWTDTLGATQDAAEVWAPFTLTQASCTALRSESQCAIGRRDAK